MKNYIMMVGRLNAKNEGFRLLNVETKKVIDLTEDEIIKLSIFFNYHYAKHIQYKKAIFRLLFSF